MHPYVMTRVAHEHAADLHRSADQRRLARSTADGSATLRSRAGWTLVHVGLRLAAHPSAARSAAASSAHG
jgi:hypothetical protein